MASRKSFPSIVYTLARALTPDFLPWKHIRQQRHDHDSKNRLLMLVEYGTQPLLMSRLPLEIRMTIWRYVGLLSPFSALVLVSNGPARLATQSRDPCYGEVSLDQWFALSANMISVLGTEYIQEIVTTPRLENSSESRGAVTAIQYALGLGGICAIRLLGVNWKGDWIGKLPRADSVWYGMMRGKMSSFRYQSNVYFDSHDASQFANCSTLGAEPYRFITD
jgi:hypothetical protein